MNDHSVEQENELEALSAIFGEDFRDVRSQHPWKVRKPPEMQLHLRPKALSHGQKSFVSVDLEVKCPPTYPDVPPELKLRNAEGLSYDKQQNLQLELNKLAEERCGEVMIYELADFVQCFLTEHNVPPSSSFHEEMLKNQRRLQELLALEEQQKMDQRRRQEEQTQNEILAEIQRREEEKREEKKKKEMAKLERMESTSQPVLERQTSGSPSDPSDVKKPLGNRRRTTSSSRHRRDTFNEETARQTEVLHFSNSSFGEVMVHRGKCIGESERLGRSVYYAFNSTSGDFAVVYEWILRWNTTVGKFFTSQEKEKIDKCKKQIHGAESELNSLLKLHHPNLVHYQGLSCIERDDCLMVDLLAEHVPGSSLAQKVSSNIPMPIDQLRHHTVQLVRALDFLHSNSVVHKQLSASCVLLDAHGDVRLSDYSLAKRLSDVCKEDIFEQGHVRFCEDALPTRPGKKGDVWSLGLMLLALAQGREVKEYPVSIPTILPADLQDFLNSHLLSAPFSTEVQNRFSRYYNEFSELQLLGKGAFGAVIKVQNKLDGCYYAVKRIQVNPASKQFRRIKGEVTLLSRLNHENIVRYYNAWIERHETPVTGASNSDTSETQSTPERPLRPAAPSRWNELGLADNIEDDAPPPAALTSSVEWSTSLERSSSAKCSAADSTDDEEDDDEEADVFCPSFLPHDSDSESDIIFGSVDGSRDSFSQEEPIRSITAVTSESSGENIRLTAHYLYIQMEYCEKSTLRDTIDEGLHLDVSRLWRLFREILDGLAYIHEQGMIHRDLKPVNIFLDSQDHMKIGDFGLATDHPAYVAAGKLEAEETNSIFIPKGDPSDNMTGMVGTALYVGPEVEGSTKANYNQKVDLFSLGIILFEMSYRPMSTASERISVLGQLRKDSINFPEDFSQYESGTQRKVISWLLNHDPALRPTAVELLKSDLLPPPLMEESELHEVLQHTMANVNGKAYRTMVNQLFSQNISPVMDFTYDSDAQKGSFHYTSAKLQQHVYDTLTRIFRRHGETAAALHT
ncbi:eIF-2-alpha kinase GCN2 [Triplophysa tibetana]|uniref:eIF-2-alpha kinase GCN2 n=1 Tax=Triplophysa tibetana TaxID=1572043 RepID=A0A5A9NNG2_9TELE|nr:eIF-2-alpha kinase GCN2 [Triplophysa tibetana]